MLLLLLLKNGQWDVCTGQHCSAKETVFGSLPNFYCLEKRSGRNRIGHPDWVKLCIKLNCAPNQNTKFPSTTYTFMSNTKFPSPTYSFIGNIVSISVHSYFLLYLSIYLYFPFCLIICFYIFYSTISYFHCHFLKTLDFLLLYRVDWQDWLTTLANRKTRPVYFQWGRPSQKKIKWASSVGLNFFLSFFEIGVG